MKLSNERVREILADAHASLGLSQVSLSPSEALALAQEVLDLRTANGMLEEALAEIAADELLALSREMSQPIVLSAEEIAELVAGKG